MFDKMVGILKVDADKMKELVVDESMTKWEVAFTLLISIIFIISFVVSISIQEGHEINQSVRDIIENVPYDNKGSAYDISVVWYLNNWFYNWKCSLWQ